MEAVRCQEYFYSGAKMDNLKSKTERTMAACGGPPHQSSIGSEEPMDDSFSPLKGEKLSRPRLFGTEVLTDVGDLPPVAAGRRPEVAPASLLLWSP
jgi:hypothetical protein